jgi:hypothetical protein
MPREEMEWRPRLSHTRHGRDNSPATQEDSARKRAP